MSAPADRAGRPNQKLRTRKDLLDAAARLMRSGAKPTLEEVAQEALVSRATAYRYFPSTEALLLEAAVHVAVPGPEELFADVQDADPATRLLRVADALHATLAANEPALRLMLASILEQGAAGGAPELPARQNRRSPLIEAALAPAAGRMAPQARVLLSQAVALVVGIEGLVAAKDVLGLDDAATRRLKRWMITSLAEAALREPVPRPAPAE
jgi:AcrR family transcriptional regulator